MHIIKTTKELIFHPEAFFKRYHKKSLEFVSIYTFLALLVNALVLIPTWIPTATNPIALIATAVVALIGAFVVAVFLWYTLYAAFHIIIRVFTGKRKLKDTYQLLYASTPVLIAFLIPQISILDIVFKALVILAFVDSIYLHYVGVQSIHKLTKENAAACTILIAIVQGILIYGITQL